MMNCIFAVHRLLREISGSLEAKRFTMFFIMLFEAFFQSRLPVVIENNTGESEPKQYSCGSVCLHSLEQLGYSGIFPVRQFLTCHVNEKHSSSESREFGKRMHLSMHTHDKIRKAMYLCVKMNLIANLSKTEDRDSL